MTALQSWSLPCGVPHAARVADHRRHGGVDDDVAGHVQVGDAPVRVHHGDGRAVLEGRLDVGFDGRPLLLGESGDLGQHVAEPVVGIDTQLLEDGGVLGEDVLEEDPHAVTEHDGVGDLHHGGLQVEGEQDALVLGVLHLLPKELHQGPLAHEGAVQHLARPGGGGTPSAP